MKKIASASLLVLVFVLVACAAPQTKTQKGATYGAAGGAAAGAIIGQVIGGHTESTLWGAAIGAAVGGLGGAGISKMMAYCKRSITVKICDHCNYKNPTRYILCSKDISEKGATLLSLMVTTRILGA